MIRASRGWPVVAAALLLGCNGEPAGDFAATLEGPLEGKVRGKAFACRPAGEEGFLVVLRDPGTGAGFLLGRASPGPLAAGVYGVVGDPEAQGEMSFWLEPVLSPLEGGDELMYRVRGGKVRILSADASWVKGRFEAELVASDPTLDVDPETGAVRYFPSERMPVSGRFSAARVESCPAPAKAP